MAHPGWVEEALKIRERVREGKWSESVAVGDSTIVEKVNGELGGRALGRKIVSTVEGLEPRERQVSYNGRFDPENTALSYENGLLLWVYDDDSI